MTIGLLARKTLHSQPGGDTVQVKQSAAALERLGHTCFIITSGTALSLSCCHRRASKDSRA